MRLAACGRLTLRPFTCQYYRVIDKEYNGNPLGTAHTKRIASRFNPGRRAVSPFQTLYTSENPVLALFEFRAVFGPPANPVANPKRSHIEVLPLDITLQSIADLTDPKQIAILGTTAQELTGAWNVTIAGVAPTQQLGEALFGTPDIEGFLALSAVNPSQRNLLIFPEKLKRGSQVRYENTALTPRKIYLIKGKM